MHNPKQKDVPSDKQMQFVMKSDLAPLLAALHCDGS